MQTVESWLSLILILPVWEARNIHSQISTRQTVKHLFKHLNCTSDKTRDRTEFLPAIEWIKKVVDLSLKGSIDLVCLKFKISRVSLGNLISCWIYILTWARLTFSLFQIPGKDDNKGSFIKFVWEILETSELIQDEAFKVFVLFLMQILRKIILLDLCYDALRKWFNNLESHSLFPVE